MQIISKGYFWFSLILIVIGVIIGRTVAFMLPQDFIDLIRDSDYGIYLCIFGLGTPFAIVNLFECKYIWARLFKRGNIDLLGVSMGFVLGISSLLFA